MRTSSSTNSGSSSWTASSASLPEPAPPTQRNPGVAATTSRATSRKTTWSSTPSTPTTRRPYAARTAPASSDRGELRTVGGESAAPLEAGTPRCARRMRLRRSARGPGPDAPAAQSGRDRPARGASSLPPSRGLVPRPRLVRRLIEAGDVPVALLAGAGRLRQDDPAQRMGGRATSAHSPGSPSTTRTTTRRRSCPPSPLRWRPLSRSAGRSSSRCPRGSRDNPTTALRRLVRRLEPQRGARRARPRRPPRAPHREEARARGGGDRAAHAGTGLQLGARVAQRRGPAGRPPAGTRKGGRAARRRAWR